jgi:branched-chain amino acid transport system permease protein
VAVLEEERTSVRDQVLRPGPIVTVGLAVAALVAIGISDVQLGRVIVNGVNEGAVFALVALGIVLVYRSTRVLNFAQGELGTMPAFVVLFLMLGGGLDGEVDPAAFGFVVMVGFTLLAMLLGATLGVGINTLVIQRLARSSPVTSLVATASVFLLLTGMQLAVFEPRARRFPRLVEGAPCLGREGDECVRFLAVFGTRITWQNLVVLVVLLGVVAGLVTLFRTPLGVALLASAQDPFAASLSGVSPQAMSRLTWAIAGALGGLAGVLGAGVFERLTPGMVTTTFMIPAFTAAVLGGLTSMVGAVVGGLLLGLTVSLANSIVVAYGLTAVVPGPPFIATFLVLLLVLVFRPRGLLGKEA